MDRLFQEELPPALRHLDVTVLTRLILMELLGFDQQRLDDEKTIAYSSKETEAIDAVVSGEYDMSFILRPTKIEQVRQVAEAGADHAPKIHLFLPESPDRPGVKRPIAIIGTRSCAGRPPVQY